jgi:hypothetical protein
VVEHGAVVDNGLDVEYVHLFGPLRPKPEDVVVIAPAGSGERRGVALRLATVREQILRVVAVRAGGAAGGAACAACAACAAHGGSGHASLHATLSAGSSPVRQRGLLGRGELRATDRRHRAGRIGDAGLDALVDLLGRLAGIGGVHLEVSQLGQRNGRAHWRLRVTHLALLLEDLLHVAWQVRAASRRVGGATGRATGRLAGTPEGGSGGSAADSPEWVHRAGRTTGNRRDRDRPSARIVNRREWAPRTRIVRRIAARGCGEHEQTAQPF